MLLAIKMLNKRARLSLEFASDFRKAGGRLAHEAILSRMDAEHFASQAGELLGL